MKNANKLVLLTATLFFSFGLCGCTPQEKKSFIEEYGYYKAYLKLNGNIVHLENAVTFYSEKALSKKQRLGLETACELASQASGMTLKYCGANKSKYLTSKFKVNVVNDKYSKGVCATNKTMSGKTARIMEITLTLNDYYFEKEGSDYSTFIMVHELGHCLGLLDYYAKGDKYASSYYAVAPKEIIDASIMYGYDVKRNGVYYQEYQEFDQANIDYYYNPEKIKS